VPYITPVFLQQEYHTMSRKCAYLTIVKVYARFKETDQRKDCRRLAGVGLLIPPKNNPTEF
jgi:hypothetical protein